MHIAVATPAGYACDPGCIAEAQAEAARQGSQVLLTDDPLAGRQGADAIYTDTWVSMGQEAEKANKSRAVSPLSGQCAIMARRIQVRFSCIACLPTAAGSHRRGHRRSAVGHL